MISRLRALALLIVTLCVMTTMCVSVSHAAVTPPEPYKNWKSVSYFTEDPTDTAIDHTTQDVFVVQFRKKSLDVLLGGSLPRTTIYTHPTSGLIGASLFHRTCSSTGVLIYGLLFTERDDAKIMYLPLPLPANPSTSNVASTIVTAASGLSGVVQWLTQTHNSIEVYVAEYNGKKVSHWAVHSPAPGTGGTSAATVSLTTIRDIGFGKEPSGVAITSDDNVLFASTYSNNAVHKATPMLPHSATPTITTLTFTNTLNNPQKLTLHPAHNSATAFVLYVGNAAGGNILQCNGATAETDSVLLTVSTTTGYRPHGVTLYPNGTLILNVEDGLKTSCCVGTFDHSSLLAGFRSAACLAYVASTPTPTPYNTPNPNPLNTPTPYGTPTPWGSNSPYTQPTNSSASEGGTIDTSWLFMLVAGIIFAPIGICFFYRSRQQQQQQQEQQQQQQQQQQEGTQEMVPQMYQPQQPLPPQQVQVQGYPPPQYPSQQEYPSQGYAPQQYPQQGYQPQQYSQQGYQPQQYSQQNR